MYGCEIYNGVNFMRNIECKICGEKIINSLQKELKKRTYCSQNCERIPSIFQI